MTRAFLTIFTAYLLTVVGCEPQTMTPPTDSLNPAKVNIDDVRREAANSAETIATYAHQDQDRLVNELNEQLVAMDGKIEDLRIQGAELANEAKDSWDSKLSRLDLKRRAAKAKLVEIENSTARAWDEVTKGTQLAWEELQEAFQSAADEF